MIELLGYFAIMVIASLIIEFVERQQVDPLSTFLHILAFIGVFIHELSHYVMCVLFGVKTQGFKVRYRSEISRKVAPHGEVGLPEFKKISFMQAVMVAIAPLFISTFLFLFCLDVIFTLNIGIVEFIITCLFAVSLLIGSRPSNADIVRIFQAYDLNPRYSVYQIALVLLSMSIVLVFIDFSAFSVPFEFFIYIIFFLCTIGGYFMIKYTFRLTYTIYRRFRSGSHSRRKKGLRRRHRPTKPNIEEPQW